MVITVVARYRAEEAHKEEVAEQLVSYAAIVRTEPGCVTFDVNRSLDDDRDFILYEVYTDRAAFDAHVASEHFTDIAVNRIRPLLADRQATLLTPL